MMDQFEPVFVYVKVGEPTKNGDVVKYSIVSQKVTEDESTATVVRQYEDFEWLHHCMVTQNNLEGVIVPPLPPKPLVDPKITEKQTKEKLGSDTKLLKGDEYEKDSRNLEKYLKLVVTHSAFGTDATLDKFLRETEPPCRTNVKKGFFNKVTSAVNEVRKGGHKDVDEHFVKEKDWLNEYSIHIKSSATTFSKTVSNQEKLAQGYLHLATALNLGGTLYDEDDENGQTIHRLSVQLSEAYEDAKHGLLVDCANDELTMGHQLDLYARFVDAEKEMLFRRLCRLIEYEDANRAVEKAKPQKRPAAEEVQVAAEKTYQDCTEKSKKELKSFHHDRVLALQDGLVRFADAKVKTARDTFALLAKSLSSLKQIQLP
ncbi:sorting nexin-5-like [Lineus longissimus]|uniref:sorting nexin-5-like n=1 Tax=Lineus longissimus TaxID=88925 RepID=UPI002B4CD1B4